MAAMQRLPLIKDPSEQRVDPAPSPLLITARHAAAMCGKSLRTWRAWDSAGWIPKPVRVGRSTLWRADELREWVAAGCPRRSEWEVRKQ
jgi:predicted DNA-binding transcriptional regulator AlpA